jgi:hypothetical protein
LKTFFSSFAYNKRLAFVFFVKTFIFNSSHDGSLKNPNPDQAILIGSNIFFTVTQQACKAGTVEDYGTTLIGILNFEQGIFAGGKSLWKFRVKILSRYGLYWFTGPLS